VAELAAKPSYLQFRLIGAGNDGREIVRVDRSRPGGAVRVVPEPELQAKGDRRYFDFTIGLAAREAYVSPIQLNEEYGVVDRTYLCSGPPLRSTHPTAGGSGSCVLVRRVIDGMRPAIQQCEAEIICEDLPTVLADESQLRQLFQNLISNGLKFRSERPPRIDITATRQGAEWVFRVADNGIGVEGEFLERIFEMFQRLHERGKYEGSGIGLAIASKVVQRHGGRIWAESELGKGPTFCFTIPAEPPAS
jgi:hypothetical protein